MILNDTVIVVISRKILKLSLASNSNNEKHVYRNNVTELKRQWDNFRLSRAGS